MTTGEIIEKYMAEVIELLEKQIVLTPMPGGYWMVYVEGVNKKDNKLLIKRLPIVALGKEGGRLKYLHAGLKFFWLETQKAAIEMPDGTLFDGARLFSGIEEFTIAAKEAHKH